MHESSVTTRPKPPPATPRGRVLRWLDESIASGELSPGEAIPSERALAKLLGVAQNTAAAAIDEAEARGIVVRRAPTARKRFVPDAPQGAALSSATIYAMGDLGRDSDGSPEPRWTDRYLSMECFSRLARTGRHVTILNSEAMTEACVDAIFRASPAAMLITSTVAGNPLAMRALERCRAGGVPVVVHGNAPELHAFDRVYTDHRATGRVLTEWLLARGRRCIVPFFPYIPDTFWARERLAGYADAMRAAGLDPFPCAVFGTELPEHTPAEERFRVRRALAVAKLLELGCARASHGNAECRMHNAQCTMRVGPDALLCLSDNWARVAIAAMRDLGLAPHRDLLVTGHDNIDPGAEFGEFEADSPDATIDKHNETKADAMAALLAARLAGDLPAGPQCREHAFALVEREGRERTGGTGGTEATGDLMSLSSLRSPTSRPSCPFRPSRPSPRHYLPLPMKPSTLLTRLSSLVTAIAATAAIADDLYLNDFATRTSKEPIPAIGVWQTATPYPNAFRFICNRPSANNGSIDFANLASYFSTSINVGDRASCDGWFVPYFNGANGADGRKLVPRYVSSTPTSASDQFYTDSDCFSWTYGNSDARRGIAVHGIHNEFTNGQLRLQIDMKAPVTWAVRGGRVRVFPVYRKYMDILAWEGTRTENSADVTPGGVAIRGAASGSTSSMDRSYPFRFNSGTSTGTQMGNNDSGKFTDDGSDGKTNYWFRYIVTYDLGNNTFGGEIYRFSKAKGYPSFATEPSDATPYQSFSNEPAWVSLSAETGGIAGLGFAAYGSFADGTDPSVKVLLDNIRLSWKAPGTSDFEVFYENDFTTRRYRTLSAPSTTTGSYSQATASANEADTYTYPSFSGNLNTRMLIPGAVNGTSASQPVGLDSWKKLPYRDHAGGGGNAAVHAYGGTTYDAGGVGTNMLTYGDQGNFSTIGQTLGKVFTSGKVKISVDARLPEGDRLTTSIARRRMAVGLGSLALYDTAATSADACAQIAAGFGYHRLNNTGICSSKPYTLAAYSSGDEPNRDYPASYTAPETNEWYRMVVEADLDARTYDVSMTPLGTASVLPEFVPVASPIFTATDLPFAANVSDIGSFYLYGYGYGAATTASYIKSRVCFDNVRIWHNSDLIYENDFTTRTRTLTGVTRESGDVAALQFNLDGGQDHWVRRDYTGPAGFDVRAWVRNDSGNKFLALGRSGEDGRTITLVNSLGLSQTKPFRFEADIRPPSQWSAKNGYATISLGDSQMIQTETPDAFYTAHELVTFGFSGTNTANQTLCPYYFAGCKAQVGGTELDAEIDPTHWYRFRLEVNPENGTYDAQLRDMGTTHPAAATKGGTIVATATNVAFANSLAAGEGVATILIEGQNVSGAYGSLGVDPAHILIDNLRLSVPNPFLLIIQ